MASGPHLISSACTADTQSHGSPIAHMGIVALRQQRNHAWTLLRSPEKAGGKKKVVYYCSSKYGDFTLFILENLKLSFHTICFVFLKCNQRGGTNGLRGEQGSAQMNKLPHHCRYHMQFPLPKSSFSVHVFCL